MNNVAMFLERNAPTILTALGACGVVSSVVSAVYSTPKALKLLEENLPQDPKPIDYVKTAWKCYIPTALIAGASIGCIFAANSTNLHRQAALASLYTITEESARAYQDKVVKKLGAGVDEEIRDEIAKETIDKHPAVKNDTLVVYGHDKSLCYDSISGRYFKSSIEDLRRVQNDMNQLVLSDGAVSLNDLYSAMGLCPIAIGEELIWTSDSLIDMKFSSQLTDNDEPCIVISHYSKPIYKTNQYDLF